jgi:hypothetical protein
VLKEDPPVRHTEFSLRQIVKTDCAHAKLSY